jgi:amino acid adenylation domain-containing protein
MSNSTVKKTALNAWLNRKKKATTPTGIPKMPTDVPAVLSRGQKRLWLLQQLYPDNAFYQYAHAYRFRGQLNIEHLLASFQLIAQRHEVLRTNFLEVDNQIIQHIRPKADVPTEIIDLQQFTIEKQNEEIEKITRQKAQKTFDLTKDILLRITVLILSDDEHLVLLSMHHIIGDRWSLQVLNQELATTYQELQSQGNTTIPPLKIQYADYAHWQQSQPEKAEDLAYWKQQLSGELPILTLPTDAPRPARPTFRGVSTTKVFSSQLSQKIKAFCQQNNATPYTVLLAAYQILLQRYSGQDDLLIGSPFTNRDKVVLEKLIGFFNETLVLRADLSKNPTFLELIQQVKKTTAEALTHKNTPFETLVRELKPERNGTANPLFQVMFLYNTLQDTPSFGEGLQVEESVVDLGVSKFDLTLFITDRGEHLTATFEFATDLFSIETIERLHRHLENLLQNIVQSPEKRIAEFDLLTEKEREQILIKWNETHAEVPENTSIHALFEAQVSKNPNATCVVFENKKLTFQEVNDRANILAKELQDKGVSTNQFVGLHVHRSVDMVVGIVAILKSGGAYLPLDPEYPRERIEYMLADAEVKVVLMQADLVEDFSAKEVEILTFESIEDVTLDALNIDVKTPTNNPENLAYLIYTSGSTGKPKGVPITHANLVHSTVARYHFYDQQPGTFLLMSSYSFDSSVAGIFWALTQGGALILPKKRIEQDIYGLANLISTHQVTHTLLLPSLYDLLLEHAPIEKLSSLNTIMVAGEACASTVVKRHFETLPTAKLYNEYGPTEGTVWCTAHKIQTTDYQSVIPIGKPIPNVQNYILNQHFKPVPIGVAGELCIAGNGLSKGYFHRPELTAEKFIEVSFFENKTTRLYRTGDLARYRADGTIEFLGRIDQQVKIRGYRIELDEIKELILQETGVREAIVVVLKEDKQQRLAAYFTTEKEVDSTTLSAEVTAVLKEKLPNYMIPSAMVKLEDFPRLPNGKINQKALPKPTENAIIRSQEFAVPETELEQKLATIWSEVLKIEAIGRHDNFFEIGGDSILSIQIIAKARTQNLTLAANQLFEQQTIAELALALEKGEKHNSKKLNINDLPKIDQTEYPLSFMQQAFLLHSLQGGDDQGFLQLEFTLSGKIDKQNWEAAWQKTAERHPILRTAIAWEGLEKSVQKIEPEPTLTWQYLNWHNLSNAEQKEKLLSFRNDDKKQGLNLQNAPIGRLTLIKLAPEKHLFFWTCHHIILDGWSGGIVLRDALKYYDAGQKEIALKLAELPSYASFLHWNNSAETEDAQLFWQNYLANFSQATLFENGVKPDKNKAAAIGFKNHSFTISEAQTAGLNRFARQHRITLNTLLRGAWGLLLTHYFGEGDVVFGTTVSGRFADFPNIEEMTGLFMNVLPTRIKANKNQETRAFFQKLQQEQTAANAFDRTNLEELNSWINWSKHKPLFDSLFVFGNFLKDGLQVGEVAVEDFHGGFTSTYPLTIRVNPISALGFDLRYDSGQISEETIEWFHGQWLVILNILSSGSVANLKTIVTQLSPTPFQQKTAKNTTSTISTTYLSNQDNYLAPRNPTELQLTKIWENLFGFSPIGVNDNFFEIGGKSLLAMQLFSKLENELNCVLPPMTVMQHPTIAELSKLIQGETKTEAWSTVVPLRASGSKRPLFCIHAGGAHVFFYNGLTKYLSVEQPVYAIQPQGLDGLKEYHLTIEEMATHYIKEVRKVQPEGPYQLLGTCFSNAVCLEMAIQMEAMGLEVSMYIVDSAPAHLIPLEKSKPVQRFIRILQDQNWSLLYRKLRRRFFIVKKKVVVKKESDAQRRLREMIHSLNSLYAAYTWKPFGGKITLIRSTQFAHREGKQFHLKQWKSLAKGGLEVHVVEGRHLTIFEEPAVQGLAEKLEECFGTAHGKFKDTI